MASFDYTPLDQTTRSIRLLRFEQQSKDLEPICCCLETHELEHCPPYAALSYVWGEDEEAGGGSAKGILVDGKPFLARPNLHAALCAIRDFEDRDRLWIKTSTALTDFSSFQTELPDLMRTLKSYTPQHKWQAVIRKVLATDCVMIRNQHHGFSQLDRQLAHWDIFRSIMDYDETWNGRDTTQRVEGWRHRYYWIDAICIDQGNDLERGHQVNMMGDIYGGAACVIAWLGSASAGSDQAMSAATTRQSCISQRHRDVLQETICDHPYWDRLWTTQEYILARDVLHVCGRQELSLGEVQALANVHGKAIENSMSWRMEARNRWHLVRMVPLDMLLEQLAAASCRDPRDRVYGLLSLLGAQSEMHHLEPDYTISEKQLYYRVLGCRLLSASQRTTLRRMSMAGRRAILRRALGVAADDDFKMNDLLYQIVECAQDEYQAFDSGLMDDPRMASCHEVLRNMCDPSHEPEKHGSDGQDPVAVYTEVINLFSGFPKEEDPITWEIFGKLLEQTLASSQKT